MSEMFESIETRLDYLVKAPIFEKSADSWDDVEQMHEALETTANLLKDIYMELRDIKKQVEEAEKKIAGLEPKPTITKNSPSPSDD